MSSDVAAIVERARLAAQKPSTAASDAPAADREQLKRIAAEFESMLLVQVLKDMRRSGSWEEEGGGDALGAQSLFETLDVELASHLAKVKGLGLGRQMEEAFDRLNPTSSGASAQLPVTTTPPVEVGLPVGPKAITPPADKPTPDVVSLVKAAAKKTAAAVEKTADAVEKTAAAPAALGHILKPVAGAVTSAFGWRRHPITHEVKFHQGVDLRAAYGQEVQAAAAGRVVFSGDQGGYGATVVVQHQDGTQTRYAHLSARLVKKGDEVGAGEPLGRAGRSGRATGTHLHFEVIAPNGQRVQPEQWEGGRQAPIAQTASNHEHDHRTSGKPVAMTAGRSIKDRSAGAD